MLRDLGIEMAGCIELSELAWASNPTHWPRKTTDHLGSLISLKRLVEFYLERGLDKPVHIQRGVWEEELNKEMRDCELSRRRRPYHLV